MCVVGLLVPATLMAKVEKVTLKGTIKGLGNEELILMNSDRSEITRTKTKNDHFEIVTEVETGDLRYYILYAPSVGPLGPSMAIPTIHFFIDSPKITVEAELKDKQMRLKSLKGSPGWEEHNRILESLPSSLTIQKVYDRYNQAFHEYNEVSMTDENMAILKRCGAKVDSLQAVQMQQLFASISSDPKNKALAVIISSYAAYQEVAQQEALLNQFDVSIRHCYGVEKMQQRIDLIKNCAVGAVAPDFELKDTSGEMIKLSSFRGKYVLVDFWASWCGPCRKALPLVKKANEEFKDKGLQVIGVSVDRKVKDWEKALEEEKLPYLQLHDPDGITGKMYNYDGIPFIILISPEGIILEKELWGDGIREAITKYIK